MIDLGFCEDFIKNIILQSTLNGVFFFERRRRRKGRNGSYYPELKPVFIWGHAVWKSEGLKVYKLIEKIKFLGVTSLQGRFWASNDFVFVFKINVLLEKKYLRVINLFVSVFFFIKDSWGRAAVFFFNSVDTINTYCKLRCKESF